MKPVLLAARLRSLSRVAVAIAALSLPSNAFACGFHTGGVLVERVGLNIVYPNAMHVLGAISTAQIEKRLPMPVFQAAVTPDLFAYQRTVKVLERWARQLTRGGPPLSFSLVLIEPMLWTHFDLGDSVTMQADVSAPEPGELVVVSGDGVIAEIANGHLSITEARRLGLLRLYGSDAQIARFLAASKGMMRSSATRG
jgi:hypothetical protein